MDLTYVLTNFELQKFHADYLLKLSLSISRRVLGPYDRQTGRWIDGLIHMYMRRQCRTTTKRVGHVIQRPCTVFEANDKKLHAISFDYRRRPEYEMRQTAAGCQRLPQRALARPWLSKCPNVQLVP